MLGIDRHRLVRLASTHDCVIELLPRIGEYVPTGGAVFAVHGGSPPRDREVLACLDLGRSRTLYQDPTFGIRQLVDVGTQALSPADQPTLDHGPGHRSAARPAAAARVGADADRSAPRLPGGGPSRRATHEASYLLNLAFQEISQLGSSSWHVTRRLAAAYDDLEGASPEDWRPTIVGLRASLERMSREYSRRVGNDQAAVFPDRLGLG